VCTPPHLHVAAAELAARAGVHALVEKPLATTLADAERLAELAARHRVVVACVNNWNQAPILRRVQAVCRSRALGALRSFEIEVERTRPAAAAEDDDNWRIDPERAGGGILFDHGWHGLALMGRAVAAEPVAVSASLTRRRHHALRVEDTAVVDIEFADGMLGRFSATWAGDTRANRVTVRGERGTLEVADDLLRVSRGGRMLEERFDESLADGGYRIGWTTGIVREFLAEIAEPGRPARAIDEALDCMRLLAAAGESNARGGETVALGYPTAARARGVSTSSTAGATVRAAARQVSSPTTATMPNERMPALADSSSDP
jgi:predicted dehydrogenase